MNTAEIERKRMARDMAEMLWRQRAGSHIFSALQGTQFIGCNAEDQTFVEVLASIAPVGGQARQSYLHYITGDAASYIVPPAQTSMLYVMRPGRLASIQQPFATRAPGYRYAVETDAGVALLYIY